MQWSLSTPHRVLVRRDYRSQNGEESKNSNLRPSVRLTSPAGHCFANHEREEHFSCCCDSVVVVVVVCCKSIVVSLCYNTERLIIIAPRPRRTSSAPITTGSLMIPSGAADSTTTTNGKMLPLRSESMAYPQPNTRSLLSKVKFCMRQNTKAVLATLAFLVFVIILSSDFVQDNYVGNGHGLRM